MKTPRQTPKPKISESVLVRLRGDLAARRINSGIDWLESHRPLFCALNPSQKNAAALLGYLAQWVDVGFDQPLLVKELLSRFPQGLRAALPLSDYLHIRMAEGLVAMSAEDFASAVRHFETVLSFENEIQDQEPVAIANFWIGRCQRRMGRYDSALKYTVKGKGLALQLEYPKMAAVMQVLESWLMFQEGKPQEARSILKEAEAVLFETDDHVTRGNIQSAYGRIARRQGRYDQALQHFADSIEEYRQRSPQHRNLARALANMAFVKRLIAFRLARKIDREVARRLKEGGYDRVPAASPKLKERMHLEGLRAEALAHLSQAEQIYARYDDHRGLGTVHVDRGLLCLDSGDLDGAATEAATAYRLGGERKDYILEARVRTPSLTSRLRTNPISATEPSSPATWRVRRWSVRSTRGGSANTEEKASESRYDRLRAPPMVARYCGRQDLPADHRGVREHSDAQGVEARGPQDFARGRALVNFAEKGPPRVVQRGAH